MNNIKLITDSKAETLMQNFRRSLRYLFIVTFALVFIQGAGAEKVHPFYNERLSYNIVWKGLTVGRVNMKTNVMEGKDLIRAYAKVSTFGALRPFYYIAGEVGSEWNYKTRKSYRAFETVYQGKKYQKRFYFFKGNRVLVKKLEKSFSNYGYPKTGNATSSGQKKEWVTAPGFHDLIGAMYWLRSSDIAMKTGKTLRLPVLPAGSKKYLLIKILGRKKVSTPYGQRYAYHVRSGLANDKNVKVGSGGDMLIKTKSPIDMYITDDENRLMVKGWTKIEVAGKVEVNLASYSN